MNKKDQPVISYLNFIMYVRSLQILSVYLIPLLTKLFMLFIHAAMLVALACGSLKLMLWNQGWSTSKIYSSRAVVS